MGEFADDIIDSFIGESGSWGFRPYRKQLRAPRKVTCWYCGKEDLRWKNVKGGGWRTAEKTGELHECQEYEERGTALERHRRMHP